GHTNYVRCLYAEGSAVVSGSDDCTVRVWDAGCGETQLTGHFHGRAGVSAVCRVGVTMWSGDNEGRVIAWKLSTCEALRVLHAHGGRVVSLRKIGSRVYSGGADGIIAVFDAEDSQLVQRIEEHRGARITAIVGPSELRRFFVWSCDTDKKIRCWYQDEYVPMTGDQERFTEGFWYNTGSTPYREFRESVLRQNKFLREKLMMSAKQNTRMLDLMSFSSTLLSPKKMQQQEVSIRKEHQLAKERQELVEGEVRKSKEKLQTLENEARTVLELLRVAQAELGVLDMSAFHSIRGTNSSASSGASHTNITLLSPPITDDMQIFRGTGVSGAVDVPPFPPGRVAGVASAVTSNLPANTGASPPTSAPNYCAAAQSFVAGRGIPTFLPGGMAGATAVTQPYSATTPLPGGMAGATAVTQPYSATTPLPGGMAGATAVTQPYSATTPLPGGMAGATAVTQPYSATTPLPGGMAGATAVTQPYSATT
ncbi:hypothetical protein TraAM80_09696, partial [Trypanosoma rangeli]